MENYYYVAPNLMRVGIILLVFIILFILMKGVHYVLKKWSIKGLDHFEKVVKKYWYIMKRYLKIKWKKLLMVINIVSHIPDHSQSQLIETIFQLYVNFYETNYKDATEHWALPEEYFPNGIRDLADMYRWIKQIRKMNYEEFYKIDYDYGNCNFEYWGTIYEKLTYRINKGELFIIGIPFIESDNPERQFEKKYMKLRNDLYALDSERCNWIIERRKYLGI